MRLWRQNLPPQHPFPPDRGDGSPRRDSRLCRTSDQSIACRGVKWGDRLAAGSAPIPPKQPSAEGFRRFSHAL